MPAPTPAPAPAPAPTPEPERIVFNIGDDDDDGNVLRIEGEQIGDTRDGYSERALHRLAMIRAERARIKAAMMNEELAYRRELSALEARHRAAGYAAMERARFEHIDYNALLSGAEANYRRELALLAERHAMLSGSYMNRRRKLESSEIRFSMENPSFSQELERERYAYNRELDALIARRNAMAASYAQKRLDLSAQHSFLAEDNALLAKEEARYKQEIDALIARREAMARQYAEQRRAIEAETMSFAHDSTDLERRLADEERAYRARLEEFRRRHDEMERQYTERVNAIANAAITSNEAPPPLPQESPLTKDEVRRQKDEDAIYEYEKYNGRKGSYTEFDESQLQEPVPTDTYREPIASTAADTKCNRGLDEDEIISEYDAAIEQKSRRDKKRKKLSYEESMPVVSEGMTMVSKGDSIFSGTVITKGKLGEYLHNVKRADKTFAKEVARLSKTPKKRELSAADRAVTLLDIIAIRRKALVMHIECLQTVVSIDKKKSQRKYAHQLSLAISDYNDAVTKYMEHGRMRLTTVSANLPSEIMHQTLSPTVPLVTYTLPTPVPTDKEPTRAQLKEQKREEKQLDKMLAKDLKALHAAVSKATDKKLTALCASFDPMVLFRTAEEHMKNDLRALIYRFDYLETSYTVELAVSHYRHAVTDKAAKSKLKELRRRLKRIKKMRKKAIALERADNIRYYTVMCTSPEACRAKRRADRSAIASMHSRITEMLEKRNAENLELISLYSSGRGRANKKFNRRLEEVALEAASKQYKKMKSPVKKMRKAKTYDPQVAIDLINKRIALTAELAKERYRRKKLKIKSVSFRNKLKSMREELKRLDGEIASYLKKNKSARRRWITAIVIILLIVAALIALYLFRSQIKALVPVPIKQAIKDWLSALRP